MGLNALENVDYLLSIMAFPFSNDFVQNELSFINTYLDEYESITKGQLSLETMLDMMLHTPTTTSTIW